MYAIRSYYEARLKDGGIQVVNTSLIDKSLIEKKRVKTVAVPCNDIADKLGNPRLVNMVSLGAYVEATKCVPLKSVEKSLSEVISSHYSHLIPKNVEALRAGAEAAKKS